MLKTVKGQQEVGIDAKGRLIIPSKFRSFLDERVTLALVKGPSIWVLNEDAWEKIIKREGLEDFSIMDEEKSAFATYLSSSAEEIQIDKQNRILIPTAHREFVQLKDTAMIVSSLYWLEIWNKNIWLQVYRENQAKFGKRFMNGLQNQKSGENYK